MTARDPYKDEGPTVPLFVYGTLSDEDGPAWGLIRDAVIASAEATTEGVLLDVPAPFPAAQFGAGKGRVRGKLLWLDPEQAEEALARLNRYEGAPLLFNRVSITARVEGREVEAEAYEWVGD